MSRFNLIDEPWIPVRFPNGSRGELGIRDTLLRAKEIAAIEDGSPLVVAALHRFLLAVLYRALEGPTDIDQAKAMFKTGFPADKIEAYLEKWRDRFWLFDEKYPFYQVADYEPSEKKGQKEWKSWPMIAAEHNANNAKVLFDHVDVTNAGSIPFSVATRWLIACQTFALGGGNSDFKYTKHAPSAASVMVLPIGRNFHDTLVFSLIPENRDALHMDKPIWERESDSASDLRKGPERSPWGFADLYSWRTRSIKFRKNDDDCLDGLALASGIGCMGMENLIDPMVGYELDEKKGRLPVKFKERGLWREFDSLLPDGSNLAPRVIEHATRLVRNDTDRYPIAIMALGQSTDQAKVKFWRIERFAFPRSLIITNSFRTEIKQILDHANKSAEQLEWAVKVAGKWIIARGGRDLPADDIRKFIGKTSYESLPVVLVDYWSMLETSFHEVLHAYDKENDPEKITMDWLAAIKDALHNAWNRYQMSVSTGDIWTIRAMIKAEGVINRKLNELDTKIAEYMSDKNKEPA